MFSICSRFGTTAKPVDNVHAPDFSSNRCASFLHPYIEHYSHGEYVDQMELHESLIVRYDDKANAAFPQWTSSANENYIKYYINSKVSQLHMIHLYPIHDIHYTLQILAIY